MTCLCLFLRYISLFPQAFHYPHSVLEIVFNWSDWEKHRIELVFVLRNNFIESKINQSKIVFYLLRRCLDRSRRSQDCHYFSHCIEFIQEIIWFNSTQSVSYLFSCLLISRDTSLYHWLSWSYRDYIERLFLFFFVRNLKVQEFALGDCFLLFFFFCYWSLSGFWVSSFLKQHLFLV